METVRIISRTDSSVHSDTLVRQDGVATSSYPAAVANDFGNAAYNTSVNRHVYLMSGNILNGTTPALYARLPAADGPDGDGQLVSVSAIDPHKELASLRVYDSGICSSSAFGPGIIGLVFPGALEKRLNKMDEVFGAEVQAYEIVPVFRSDDEPLSNPMDFMSVRLTWDADLIEGGLIGNVFECNGARVRMNFDLYFEIDNGSVDVLVENFYVHVSQQPGWSGGIGANRCRPRVRSRIEDFIIDKAPPLIKEGVRDELFANATRLSVADLGLGTKACNTNGTCSWSIGGKSFRGGCDKTNTCAYLYPRAKRFNLRPDQLEIVWLNSEDDDEIVLNYQSLGECNPTRGHVNSASSVEPAYDAYPYVSGNLGLLH